MATINIPELFPHWSGHDFVRLMDLCRLFPKSKLEQLMMAAKAMSDRYELDVWLDYLPSEYCFGICGEPYLGDNRLDTLRQKLESGQEVFESFILALEMTLDIEKVTAENTVLKQRYAEQEAAAAEARFQARVPYSERGCGELSPPFDWNLAEPEVKETTRPLTLHEIFDSGMQDPECPSRPVLKDLI